MRLVVVGAAGRTGRLIVGQALGHGHDVTAVVRDAAASGLAGERLTIIEGDATAPAVLQRALEDAAAVVSAVGSPLLPEVHVYSDVAADLVRLMTARGTRRLIVISSAGVHGGTGAQWWLRLGAATVMRGVMQDLERMEDEVLLSDLDWTIVRPAGLTDAPAVGDYRTAYGALARPTRIARGDLAGFALKCAETRLFVRETAAIAY